MEDVIKKILSGSAISGDDAMLLAGCGSEYSDAIIRAAASVRAAFSGNEIELCAIVNARSGLCSEDCAYCAQSSISTAGISVYPLMSKEAVIQQAKEAHSAGVSRFSIVTSGRKPAKDELKNIGVMISRIKDAGLKPCASLGLLNREELDYLKSCGLERYHNNLETSERFFPQICTTHTFSDKTKTIEAAKSVGLSVCSGGIFGLGESWQDRVDMALALQQLGVDSVPMNFLSPIKGTPLGSAKPLMPDEALRIIAIYRMLLPDRSIRICGGRITSLCNMHEMIFDAGADSLMTGNYLTTTGRTYADDTELVRSKGLLIKGF